jgi:hypothetical protein
LRPAYRHTVHESTYLNRLRLGEWRNLFEATMPGVVFVKEPDDEVVTQGLRELRAAGELGEYTDEELLSVNLVAIWKKPSPSQARIGCHPPISPGALQPSWAQATDGP